MVSRSESFVRPFLPPRATLARISSADGSGAVRSSSAGRNTAIAIASVISAIGRKDLDMKFPRDLFLRWLEETAGHLRARRARVAGDHPYAPVQLLTVAHAADQEWSHLIFAGWNDGVWPPPAGGEFAREEEIAAFNQKIHQLNERAARRGRQGEGHIERSRKPHILSRAGRATCDRAATI